MTGLPTREQAEGILILRNVQVANNSDGIAVVQAYVDGELLTHAEWETIIDYEADAEAIYSYLEATNMQGASLFPWANTAKRRWINAYKAALAETVRPDVRAWHTVFMQALYGGADKNTAYDAVLDAALGVGGETP